MELRMPQAIFWALQQYEELDIQPERVLVTGCSAGAYGSWLWGNVIAKHFLDLTNSTTKVFQMADSGMGIISDEFYEESFSSWKANEANVFPQFLFQNGEDIFALTQADLYNISAHFFLNASRASTFNFGQVSSTFDWNQAFFYFLQRQEEDGGGDARSLTNQDKVIWNLAIHDDYNELLNDSPSNLHHFLLPGDFHSNIDATRHYPIKTGDGQRFFKVFYDLWQGDVPLTQSEHAKTLDCEFKNDCQKGVDLRESIPLL